MDKWPEHQRAIEAQTDIGVIYIMLGDDPNVAAVFEKLVTVYAANPWVWSNECTVTIAISGLTYMGEYVPGFSCPAWHDPWCWLDHVADPLYDGCGNELKITCLSGDCCYKYWYNDSPVGHCVWLGGINWFMYRKTVDEQRFVKTEHCSGNEKIGIDSDGEACWGWYCWREEHYECLTEVDTVKWRRNTTQLYIHGWPGDSGTEDCPGPPGLHKDYPN